MSPGLALLSAFISQAFLKLISARNSCSPAGSNAVRTPCLCLLPQVCPALGLVLGGIFRNQETHCCLQGLWTLHEMQTAHDQAGPGLHNNLRNSTKTLGKEEMKKSRRERWILRDGGVGRVLGGCPRCGMRRHSQGRRGGGSPARERQTLESEGRTQV